jgi:hypothetical protein
MIRTIHSQYILVICAYNKQDNVNKLVRTNVDWRGTLDILWRRMADAYG